MSDISQGPGWWIASDNKWYPPDLHPSVQKAPPVPASGPPSPGAGSPGGGPAHVGPHFPDLFAAALQGAPMADIVSVRYDGTDERAADVGRHGVGGDSFTSRPTPAGPAKARTKRRHRKEN